MGTPPLAAERKKNASPLVVGVGDMKVSDDPEEVIVTYALGSCIALILYDPVRKAAGMLHYMLPLSKANPEKAKTNPAMFADTGVPLLFKTMFHLGCRRENLVVKAAGGGTIKDEKGVFNIGKRNHTVLRKILWKNEILLSAEDVGGRKSRTVRLYVEDGLTVVSSREGEEEL